MRRRISVPGGVILKRYFLLALHFFRDLFARPTLPTPYDPEFPPDAQPSIAGIANSVVSSLAEGVGRNKIASSLALIALIVALPLVLGTRYDERPRYRQVLLPDIQRLEQRYRAALERAANAESESGSVSDFIDAHERAVDVLDFIRSRRAVTADGTRAHSALIRYYGLVDDHFAILRSEMSIDQDLDFLSRWEEITTRIQPIYDRWSTWIEQ